MYIAMNRFKVIKGHEEEFERRWLGRDTYLDQLPGFVEFHLLRGPGSRRSHALFLAYGVGEQGRLRELDAVGAVSRLAPQRRRHKPLHLGHPEFEGFETIQTLKNKHAQDAAA